MYKVRAKFSFVDKYTDKVYAKDEIIECEDARGKELLADKRGLVELVEAPAKTEVKTEAKPKTTTRKRATAKK